MLTPLRAMTLLGFVWLLPVSEIAEARGPRGGGGRSIGGFSRGAPAGGSLAAPGGRLSAPAAGQFSAGQRGGGQFAPTGARSPADVQQFLSGQTPPAAAGQQYRNSQQQRNGQYGAAAQSAAQNFQNGPQPFSPAWYADHPQAWQYTHPHADAAVVASAAAVTGWLAYGTYPMATSSSTTVVYESTSQTAISENAPLSSPSDATPQWLPLGVYGLSPTTGALSAQSVQLSVAQNGALRGVYFDQLTGTTQNLSGRVDSSSGQAEWSLDGSSTRFTTTLADLTQPSGTVQVTLAGGQQTAWTLTRADGS
ncbi:hypothetical protein Pla123a_34960 [Posidoniimonas polymericola]|uniref:Uncharacterized protein n=1 Tax=Posidoniimonas polymericola TaxID=2528002 RepID=A0A5C5YIH8_9BACT|nr:hypothetical protein [Posidoniimonas polymericola]TWT74672.1 hypothetical protein Pla123a_34960 [Posidoniimonas polymericola]